MQRRTRTFEWKVNNHHTGPGWIPVNVPSGWYPGAGFLTSHDTVEHLSNKSDWAHELRATGVSVFTMPGVKHRSYASIASDMLSFAQRDHKFMAPANPPPLAFKKLPAHHERSLQAFMATARRHLSNAMAAAEAHGVRVPDDDKVRAPRFLDEAEPWIRLGYRGAMRVYGEDRRRDTGALMDAIRDAINKDHDDRVDTIVAGDRITVDVDVPGMKFELKRDDLPLSRGVRLNVSMRERIEATFRGFI